jgi:16S rRNA (guanine(527)-N(7))-methyltransferase RsmG
LVAKLLINLGNFQLVISTPCKQRKDTAPSIVVDSRIEPPLQPERIAEILQPFLEPTFTSAKNTCHSEPAQSGGEESAVQALSQGFIAQISTYIDILLRWNARINLTAIRNPEEIVTRHFGESLFTARNLFPRVSQGVDISSVRIEHNSPIVMAGLHTGERQGLDHADKHSKKDEVSALEGLSAIGRTAAKEKLSLADLGSGAGFPGIPIKLWTSNLALTLIESNHKKATFLREVTRALTLTDINILADRAESLTTTSFDIVTLRAVERFESILPTAVRLVAPGGRLALLIGAAQQSAACYALRNLAWSTPVPIPLSQSRVLMIARKEAEPD